MSAAAFAKGLLDLEGPLTPILVGILVFNVTVVTISLVTLVFSCMLRSHLLARIHQCWMDLKMQVLRWMKLRFAF